MGSLNHTTETRRREDERDLFQKFAWILNTKLTLEYINSLNLLMMGENKSHGNKYSFCFQSFLVKKWLLWVAYDPDRRIHFLLTIAQQQAEPWSHGGELLASPSRVRSNSLPPRFWLFHCTGLPRDSDVCCRASHWSHSRDWYARSLPCCDSSNAGRLSVFFCQVIFLAARVGGGVHKVKWCYWWLKTEHGQRNCTSDAPSPLPHKQFMISFPTRMLLELCVHSLGLKHTASEKKSR